MRKFYFSPTHPWFGPAFAVRGVGVEEPMPPSFVDRPDGTDAWLLVLFHDPVMVRLGSTEQPLPAGSAILWPPGRPHYFGHGGSVWKHTWLHVCGRRLQVYLEQAGPPTEQPFACSDMTIAPHLEAIYRELLSHTPPELRLLEALVQIVLMEAERAAAGGAGAGLPPRWRELRQYMVSHLADSLTVPILARRLGLSSSHFATQFRQRFGDTPQRTIERLRLDQAAHLLADRNLQISEVARLVGFEDPLYFSKRFHRVHGQSPRQWRLGLRAGS